MATKLEKRLTELQTEAAEIRQRLATAEKRHAEAEAELTTLRAKAGRGDADAQARLGKAQGLVSSLSNEIEIDRAALESCEADIAQARADLNRAALVARWEKLAAMYTEIEQLAGRLDADPLNATLWTEIHTAVKLAESTYRGSGLRDAAGVNFTTLFQSVPKVAQAFLENHAGYCHQCIAGLLPPSPPKAADAMGLKRTLARVESLKP